MLLAIKEFAYNYPLLVVALIGLTTMWVLFHKEWFDE